MIRSGRGRRKVTGRTKTEVQDKLKAVHAELDRGLHTSARYTVRQAVDDWLESGLPGRSERTHSISREALIPLLERIGAKPLRELTAHDVRKGLEALSDRLSTRYLQIARASLARDPLRRDARIWSAGTWLAEKINQHQGIDR